MKRTALRIMIAATAALAAVATASAQGMKAEIPFPFEAAGARMQPGAYWITVTQRGAGPSFQIYNLETNKSILAMSHVANAPATSSEASPTLTFSCLGAHCVLSSLRDYRATVYALGNGKNAPGARIATVPLRVERAE